jgi:archaeal flagellar protein FlaJ
LVFGLGKKKNNKVKQHTPLRNMNKNALHFDMYYQLAYMSVIAAAGVPRSQIFAYAAQVNCASADYFHKIELTCRQLQYDYAKACQVVGESSKEEDMKGLLLRFSSSLLSGEPERDFLVREAEALAESYNNEYGRKLETLKLWTDAYISLILSAVLVVIVGIVSTMIWKIEMSFILGLVALSIGVTAVGLWLIYIMCPREFKVLNFAGSKEQKTVKKYFRLAVPAAIIVSALLFIFGQGLGSVLIAIGIIATPIGAISRLDDTKVQRRDSEIGAFLRSLGGIATATGTTVRDAITRIDLKAIHFLRTEVNSLYSRFTYGIGAKLCWDKFIEESGSEVANRSVGMFYDAIDLGGEPEQAGYHASLFANNVSALRERRRTVSSPFSWLCVAMHAAVVALLIFISQIITIFGDLVQKASANLPDISGSSAAVGSFTAFNFSGLGLLNMMVLPLVTIYTVANALAPTLADGGSKYKMLFHLGITSLISGGCLLLLPKMAGALFSGLKM